MQLNDDYDLPIFQVVFSLPPDFPCEVGLKESVDYVMEPRQVMNFTQFSLHYIDREEKPSTSSRIYEPRFGGHPTLEEREQSFYAENQTLHCGFVRGYSSSSTGFDLDMKDKAYMNNCKVAVSSCIFGSSDFLRRPTSRKVNVLLLSLFNFSVPYFCDGSKTFWDVQVCDVLISHHLLSFSLSYVNGINKMYTDRRKSDGKRNYFLQSRNYRS